MDILVQNVLEDASACGEIDITQFASLLERNKAEDNDALDAAATERRNAKRQHVSPIQIAPSNKLLHLWAPAHWGTRLPLLQDFRRTVAALPLPEDELRLCRWSGTQPTPTLPSDAPVSTSSHTTHSLLRSRSWYQG